VEFINEGPIWALVAFTIFASTVIHGLTARETVRLLLHDDDSAEPSGEPPGPAV
jgi:NhaP-type Na+/H+ or K+/H+ antiporter